jgi:enamine deaminase RidA (YjgF/YER057c/UK114 family)
MKSYPTPANVSPARGYSHVVATSGGRTVYVAGQIAMDKDGNVVGKGDIGAQTRQVLQNVTAALEAAGATWKDVVKANTYVVNLGPDSLPAIREARAEFYPTENPPASTLVGVTALAFPDLLIEIEVVAVVD